MNTQREMMLAGMRLREAGWFTRDQWPGRWYLTRRGSTLETTFDEACKVQKRRDAATKGRIPTGPTLTQRALKADADSRAAYARGREEERHDCIEDIRAEAAPCGCAMRIEARVTRGDAP